MSLNIQQIIITRSGQLLQGSPFSGRVYMVTGGSGQRFENVPEIAKAQRAEVLSLNDITADVRIGDLLTLPEPLVTGAADGGLRKIYQVRRYDHSLQVGLQRLPFSPLSLWLPKTQMQRTDNQTLKVKDASYSAATVPTLLGYLDPAPDAVKLAAFGKMDLRAAFLYTLQTVPLGSVVKDTFGDFWVAELPSDVWPLPGDYKTLMRHLVTPPAGVS